LCVSISRGCSNTRPKCLPHNLEMPQTIL
jgi:hypothetical protein